MKEIVIKLNDNDHKMLEKFATLHDKFKWSKEDHAMNEELCRELAYRFWGVYENQKKKRQVKMQG